MQSRTLDHVSSNGFSRQRMFAPQIFSEPDSLEYDASRLPSRLRGGQGGGGGLLGGEILLGLANQIEAAGDAD